MDNFNRKNILRKYRSLIYIIFGILLIAADVLAPTTITENDITTINLTASGTLVNFSSADMRLGGNLTMSSGIINLTNPSTNNALKIDQNGNTGASPATGGAINIDNTDNAGTALMILSNYNGAVRQDGLVYIDVQNASYDGPILRINSISTDSEGHIRIDALAPEIELVETDQVAPNGKFEIRVQDDQFQINTRNSADSSFLNTYLFNSLIDNSLLRIFTNVSSTSNNIIELYGQRNSATTSPGIAWRNTNQDDSGGSDIQTARISSAGGSSFQQSTLLFQVANSTRDLINVLKLDYDGKIIIYPNKTSVTCDGTTTGAIYYDNSTFKHYGCNSTAWNAFY